MIMRQVKLAGKVLVSADHTLEEMTVGSNAL